MQTQCSSTRIVQRRTEIAKLIRNSYTDLRRLLRSPYVDGPEIYRMLLTLGHDLSGDGPEIVSEALGWKCMRLPVANIEGKPKHYLPHAVPTQKLRVGGISQQVTAYVGTIREYARDDCCGLPAVL